MRLKSRKLTSEADAVKITTQADWRKYKMEYWKRKDYVRKFLELSEGKQNEVLAIMEEFKIARQRKQNQKAYHMKRPINRSSDLHGM